MKTQTITFTSGDSYSAHVALEWGGEAFDLATAASAIFSVKISANRPDTDAKIQKALGAGITSGLAGWADIAFVPQDTLSLSVGLPYVWDFQIQALDGAVRTVAAGTLTLQPGVTREITTSIPVITTEEPLPIIIGEGGASTPLSSTTPAPLGAAGSAGTSPSAARGDHVHARPTPAEIGAAAASHTHPATAITEDSTHRFVTDAEKTAWNAGGGSGVDQTARDAAAAALARANHTGTQAISTVVGLQVALDTKAATTHSHAATDITQDATHRFVTDAEKATWNAGGGAGVDQTARDSAAAAQSTADDALALANTADTRSMSAAAAAQSAQTAADNAYIAAQAAETPAGAQTKADAAHAAAIQRANHTGTQAISTIGGLQTALDAKAAAASLGSLATAPVTVSTSAPSGTPATGAIWFQYTP